MFVKVFNIFKSLPIQNCYRLLHKHIFKMDKAYLRHLEGAEQFQITFQYTNPEQKIDRQFNFSRQMKETVSVFLNRVTVNVEKAINKKNKKRKGQSSEEENSTVNVQLCLNDSDVNGDTICEQVFKEDSNNSVILKLLDKEYRVIINSPWVDGIALPKSILANFPVYPSKFDTIFTDKDLSEFAWHKSENKVKWTLVGSGFVYVPKNEDINSYLKISCTPKNQNFEGPITETISEVKVEASPGHCPFETRHEFTKARAVGREFRVVTYNILADLYCDSDFSRTSLYPYCPPYALSIDYRKQLILKELIGYNADIICLQELDKKVYIHDLDPVFTSLNYTTSFQLKGGGLVAEGLACIFNKDRFRQLESNCIVVGEELNKNPIFADIWEKVSQNEKLTERFLQRTTAVQTVALESTEHDEIVLVANTHLYFHPDSDHIRLLQGGLAIRYVTDVFEKLRRQTNKRISLIFCGDFNSVPECGIYQLYTTGSVSEQCIDWESNIEEAVRNLSLKQPFQMASACGTPQYTNFTAGFAACLDYIYYDKTNLEVAQVIPLPSLEELIQHTALPSIVFPSDHISLASDLRWL